MKNLKLDVALAELQPHPYATTATFPLLDNKPNGNNWLITEDEFEAIKNTAVGMPVKMRFDGFDIGNHPGATPIGVIRNVYQEDDPDGETKRLIAEATLWNDEYPEEIQWLHDQFNAGKRPGISYEMGYKNEIYNGAIKQFKECVALAATFVKAPSYGTRTHLLALASLEEKDRNEQLLKLAEQIVAAKPPIEGGNRMDEKELEELKRAHASEIEKLNGQITTLTGERDSLATEKETLAQENAELKKETLIGERLHAYAEAGLTITEEEKETKKELFASFTEPQWTAYLGDLKAAKKTAPKADDPKKLALASLQIPSIPRVAHEETDLNEIKNVMRGLARPHAVSE